MLIASLLPRILPELPGCPDGLAEQHLLDAAIEFFSETKAWDEVQDPMPLQDEVHTYEVDTPVGAEVCVVRSVHCGGLPISPKTKSWLTQNMPDWPTARGSQPAYYSGESDYASIRVYPIPANVNGATLILRVAYQPKDDAKELPDYLGKQFRQAICNGAKSTLMLMPGKAWSNPQLATFYGGKFEEDKNTARVEVLHDRVEGSVVVAPRRFG